LRTQEPPLRVCRELPELLWAACGITCSVAATAARPSSISPATTTPSSRSSLTPALGFPWMRWDIADAHPFSPGDPSPSRRRPALMGATGLLMAHARRSHRHDGTSGHVWQGRFKAFIIQDDDHLRTVLRYVERNALLAELVARAEDWKWSSLPGWLRRAPLLWRSGLQARDKLWLARVNEPLSETCTGCDSPSSVGCRLAMNHGLGRPPGVSGSSRYCDQEGNREQTARKFVMSPFLSPFLIFAEVTGCYA
jgi:hypothetical protein